MRTMYGSTTVKQGDLIILEISFSDFKRSKLRPAFVVSNNRYNKIFDDVVVVGVYSRITDRDFSTIISNDDLKQGFLVKTSMIKVDSIFKVEKELIYKKIGVLKESKLNEVKEIMRELFEIK